MSIRKLSIGGTAAILWLLLLGVVASFAFTAAPALAAPIVPTVTIDPVGAVTATTAQVSGTVDPNGGPMTVWDFQYSKDPETEGWTASTVTGLALASDEPVSGVLEGLQPNASYVVRLVAINEESGEGVSAEPNPGFKSLPAAPEVTAEPATAVSAHEATLEAQVNPNNQETTYTFEYAPVQAELGTASAKKLTGTLPAEYAPGNPVSVSTGANLTQVSTYYYQVVAKNKSGEEKVGGVEHFRTGLEAPTATGPPAPLGTTTATLHGVLNPNQVGESGSYEFRYRASATECEGENEQAVPAALGSTMTGAKGQAAESVEVTGLEPGRRYTFCLLVKNAAEEPSPASVPVPFTTLIAEPTVTPDSTSATEVTDSSAELHAQINPGGGATTYRFEYLTNAQFQANGKSFTGAASSTPESVSIGSDNTLHPVLAAVEGLEPDTEYRYRVVATNASALHGVPGEELAFRTQSKGESFALLDNRAWELVSPQEKNGSDINPISYKGGDVQAAEDGDAMTYSASGPVESQPRGSEPEANVAPGGSQVLSTRGAHGWTSKDIAAPHALGYIPEGEGFEYKTFSSNLEGAILEPQGTTLLPAPTKNMPQEQTIYLRNGTSGLTGPLVNEFNIKSGAHLGNVTTGSNKVTFEYASRDLHHVLFESAESLVPEEVPGTVPAATPGSKNVYEWSGEPGQLGTVQLVSQLPHGEGSAEIKNYPGNASAPQYVARDAMSTDGSRVAWTGGPSEQSFGNGGLYVTDMEKHESILIAPATGKGKPKFQGANAEGTRIFFTDQEALLPDADHSFEGLGDLYVFEVPRSGGPLAGTIRDLTADLREVGGQKENGLMLGYLMGYGAEGFGANESMYMYFVDNGVLSENAGAGGQVAVAGGQNLYVERLSDGAWQAPRFIASLSLTDARSWGGESKQQLQDQWSLFAEMTSRVSGSGRFLAFMSSEPLTGFDNRDVVSGVRDEEVFVYDAQTDSLVCASCDPSGARPHGVLDFGVGMLVDEQHSWVGHWLAGGVPGWTPNVEQGLSTYQSHYLSDSGRLFFDSEDALVPGDVNGTEDVYEYEPAGVGPENARCEQGASSQGVVFRPAHKFNSEGATGEEPAGCVGLISSGTSPEESAFLDASGTGANGEEAEDVFFLTKSQLVGADHDNAYDVYDAHTCSTKVPCPSGASNIPPACSDADSCRAAPALQPSIYGAPASATFNGAGNPAPGVATPPKKAVKKTVRCRHGFTKKKNKCLKIKKKSARGKSSATGRVR